MGAKKLVMKYPFRYAEEYNSQMCLYKLCFNDHFFIAGCKRLKKRVLQHSEEIERKLRLGCKENDIYEHVINYIELTGCKEFVVHLIFPIALESEIPLYEQRVFDLVKDNPLCLNTRFIAQSRTYQAQSSIYRQLKSVSGTTKKEEEVSPEPEPVKEKRSFGKKKQQIEFQTKEGLEVEAPPMTIKSNAPAPVNSFMDALNKINQSYAKDGN